MKANIHPYVRPFEFFIFLDSAFAIQVSLFFFVSVSSWKIEKRKEKWESNWTKSSEKESLQKAGKKRNRTKMYGKVEITKKKQGHFGPHTALEQCHPSLGFSIYKYNFSSSLFLLFY